MFVAQILMSTNTLVRLVNGNSTTLRTECQKSDEKNIKFFFASPSALFQTQTE